MKKADLLLHRFKDTELGQFPESWEVKRLGKFCETYSGGTPSTGHPEFYGGDIPWITSADLNAGRIRDVEGRITEAGLANSPARTVSTGTLLVAMYGATAGVVAITEIEGAINQAVLAVLPRQPSQEFLYQYLRFHREHIISTYRQGGQPNLNGEIIRKIAIPLPPEPEMRAIARALLDADTLIESLDALIAKERALKHGAIQALITGRKRLSKFRESRESVRTNLGEFPRDWTVKPLGSCLKGAPSYGVNAAAVPHDDELPTYLRITDIDDDGQFAPSPLVSVDHPDSDAHRLQDGDLVFARTGASVGKSYLYNQRDGVLVFAGFLIRVRPNAAILDPRFLAYYTRSKRYWDWVLSTSARTGQPGINGKEYCELEVPLPALEEQSAIATLLSSLDLEISAFKSRRDKIRALKQGMMQSLLTGRVRLFESARGASISPGSGRGRAGS